MDYKKDITMAAIRAYTTIEQSRKLAKILPLESADMKILPFTEREYRIVPINDISVCGREDEIYAWSLAALLDVYPMIVGRDMDMYCCWQNSKHLCSRHYDNPVDACYEMILKLYELKLL